MSKKSKETKDKAPESKAPENKGYPSPYQNPGRMNAYLKGSRAAKRRRRKKIAAVIFGIGLTGVTVLGIVAFLGRVSGNFTIRLDNHVSDATIALSKNPAVGDKQSFLVAGALEDAKACAAEEAYTWALTHMYGEVDDEGNRTGNPSTGYHRLSQTIRSEGKEVPVQKAILYVYYLQNESFRDVTFDMDMVLTAYVKPTNAANEPYSYLRIATFDNVYDPLNPYSEGVDLNFTVYAALNENNTNTLRGVTDPEYKDNGIIDHAECKGAFVYQDLVVDGEKTKIRNPNVSTVPELRGYCEPLLMTTTANGGNILFHKEDKLTPNEIRQYGILCWMEGNDPECMGTPPNGVEIAFGINYTVID